MSILDLSRIYFKGEMSWNPCTSNNSPAYYDEDTNTEVNIHNMDRGQYQKFMMGLDKHDNIRSGWDYFGDHATKMNDSTAVTGASDSQGNYISSDPLIGKQVQILGNVFNAQSGNDACRLVDVDPYAAWTSQIFFDKTVVGDDEIGFSAPRAKRMFSYDLNFSRNLNVKNGIAGNGDLIIAGIASVIWQTVLKKDELDFKNSSQSPILSMMMDSMDDAGGLMLRMCTYRTLYYQNGLRNSLPQTPRNGQELSDMYLKGEVFDNPAYSLISGTIGIWNGKSPASIPVERLLSAGKAVEPKNEILSQQKQAVKVPLGPVRAQVNVAKTKKFLSLDMLSTIPELDASGVKANFGTLTLKAGNSSAKIEYDVYKAEEYEKFGGIVDLEIDSNQASDFKNKPIELFVQQTSGEVKALEEVEYHCASDDRGIYLDEGQAESIQVQIYKKGSPAANGTKVLIVQYDNNLQLIKSPKFSKSNGFVNNFYVDVQPGNIVEVQDGVISFSVSPLKDGVVNLLYLPFEGDSPVPPESLNTEFSYFSAVRCLPFDNELKKLSDEEVSWERVYEEVLKVYDYIYPVMSQVVPLYQKEAVAGMAQQVQLMTNLDFWESTLFMPVTRDMSAGKRDLLNRWLNKASRGLG